MASERERRFLNLERPRREEPDEAPPDPAERFVRVEAPGQAPAETPVPEGATDRFRDPKERPLEVAPARDGEQPFARCAACQMDNTVYAVACQNCGADLTTREQQVFNERLWAKRKEEAAGEAAAHAELERERQRAAEGEARARRELGETLARREAARVEERLGGATWGEGGWGRRGLGDPHGDGGGGASPYGLRLLRTIENPVARIAVMVGAIALPILMIVLPDRRSGWRVAGMLVAFVVAAMISPPGWRYRRRRWWDW